jgi:FG-GAP repeat
MLRSRHGRQRADRTVAKEDGMKDQGRAHMRMGGLQALVLAAVLGAGGVRAVGQPLPPPCDNPLPAGPVLHQFDGATQLDRFGHSVAFGDVNGDGMADIIVGAVIGTRASREALLSTHYAD